MDLLSSPTPDATDEAGWSYFLVDADQVADWKQS